MMRLRIDITRHGKRWGEATLEGSDAEGALAELLDRLPAADGFQHSVFKETELSRLVEIAANTRVLGIRYARERIEQAGSSNERCPESSSSSPDEQPPTL